MIDIYHLILQQHDLLNEIYHHTLVLLCYDTNIMKNDSDKKLSAYSMIEVSISLVIIAIFGIATLFMQRYYHKKQMDHLTKTRQIYVMKALGQYAGTHSCLPYPCNPKEYHLGQQQSSVMTSQQYTIQSSGYIPWKVLGIPKEYSMDAYNQPFIYVMNPLLGARTDFDPFPDSILQLFTDMHNKYSFFFMNNNDSLDIVSDGYHDFISLTYYDNSGQLQTIDMNHSTSLDIYNIGNVIAHDQPTVYHKNGEPIISYYKPSISTSNKMLSKKKSQEQYMYYIVHKLYHSKHLQIETIQYNTPHNGKLCKTRYTVYRYNPPTKKHTIRNCIAYAVIAGKDEQQLLEKGKINPLSHEKIQIHITDKVMFVTRFDILTYNGPFFKPIHVNLLQATKNIQSAQHYAKVYPYLPRLIPNHYNHYYIPFTHYPYVYDMDIDRDDPYISSGINMVAIARNIIDLKTQRKLIRPVLAEFQSETDADRILREYGFYSAHEELIDCTMIVKPKYITFDAFYRDK